MALENLKGYMATVDVGQTLHRFTNWIILALLSLVCHFLNKAESKLDIVVDKVNTHETQIQVHTTQLSNINFQLGEIKQTQELWKRGLK